MHGDAHPLLAPDAGAALWRQNVELLQQRSREQEQLLTGQRLAQTSALACQTHIKSKAFILNAIEVSRWLTKTVAR